MLKILFVTFVLVYSVIIGIWCFRFPVSYKLTNGTYHDLVVDHDFTETELQSVEKANRIRKNISKILLFSSILLSVLSYVVLRNRLFGPVIFVKIVIIVSILIALVLIVVNGIRFIPGAPIR